MNITVLTKQLDRLREKYERMKKEITSLLKIS